MMKWIQKMVKKSLRPDGIREEAPQEGISPNLEENKEYVQDTFFNSTDLIVRTLTLGNGAKAFLVYINNLIDRSSMQHFIINPLLRDVAKDESWTMERLAEEILSSCQVRLVSQIEQAIRSLTYNNVALFVEGEKQAAVMALPGVESRGVEDSKTEAAVRGPREAFTERMGANLALLRMRIKDPHMVIEEMKIGQRTGTRVAVVYLKGVTPEAVVEEVRRRLSRIKVDGVLESGYLEEYIEDSPWSPFPTVANSERPDKTAAKLLEGRVAILCDGTPFVLTCPTLFIEYFQAVEDYYSRPYYVSLIRILRFVSAAVTVLLPAIWVMLVSFHVELFPTPLALTISADREGNPFPAVIEALLMGFIFEILREAGVRLPRPVGQAVSIVGALVLGEAAVQAGLISSAMVIITSLTAITSFVIPPIIDVLTLLRIGFTVSAGLFGVFGMMVFGLIVLLHAVSLRSFGVPYFSPIAPGKPREWLDVFVRGHQWMMDSRPEELMTEDPVRSAKFQKPINPFRGIQQLWNPPPKQQGLKGKEKDNGKKRNQE